MSIIKLIMRVNFIFQQHSVDVSPRSPHHNCFAGSPADACDAKIRNRSTFLPLRQYKRLKTHLKISKKYNTAKQLTAVPQKLR